QPELRQFAAGERPGGRLRVYLAQAKLASRLLERWSGGRRQLSKQLVVLDREVSAGVLTRLAREAFAHLGELARRHLRPEHRGEDRRQRLLEAAGVALREHGHPRALGRLDVP